MFNLSLTASIIFLNNTIFTPDFSYDPTALTSSLLQHGKAKELNLSILEQLETVPCQNTAHLLLPLLTIPTLRTLTSTAPLLKSFVVNSELCKDCQDREFERSVVVFISKIDDRILEGMVFGDRSLLLIQHVMLACLSNRTELIKEPIFIETLAKLKLSPSSHLFYNQNIFKEYELEHALIACSQFSGHSPPQVYQHDWLFSHVLTYVSELLNNFQNDIALEVALNTLLHFTNINFNLKSRHSPASKDMLKPIIDHLINIAVNHTKPHLRTSAATCITKLPEKFPKSQKLSLIKKLVLHQHSGVASLFIHYYKEILHNDITTLDIIYPILEFNTTWDVLEEYDRINATLNLIQYIALRKIPLRSSLSTLYLDTLTSFIKHKVNELSTNEVTLNEGVKKEGGVRTVLCVEGEDLKEPSREEQVEVIQVARCRLDLIMFNIARCRV